MTSTRSWFLALLCVAPIFYAGRAGAEAAPRNNSSVVGARDIDPRGPCKADVLALCSQYLPDEVKRELLAGRQALRPAVGQSPAKPPPDGNAARATVDSPPTSTATNASSSTSGAHAVDAPLATGNASRGAASVGSQRRLEALSPPGDTQIAKRNTTKVAFAHAFADRHGDLLTRFRLDPLVLENAATLSHANLARCLNNAMRQAKLSISPVVHHVSDACKADVRAFFVRKASDIRHDLALLVACVEDIKANCAQLRSDSVHPCLRDAKAKLSRRCAEAVTQRLIDSAEDISLDPGLNAACGKDRARLCADKGWGAGAALRCLEAKARQPTSDPALAVSGECKAAMFRRRVHDSEDIRFNFGLSLVCAADKARFCGSIQPGQARVIECLEEHKDKRGFGPRCKKGLEKLMMAKAMDARLDYGLRTMCVKDVEKLCPSLLPLLHDPFSPANGGDRIYECLRADLSAISSPDCAATIRKHVARGFKDNRMDAGLLRACYQDIERHCEAAESALECLRHVSIQNGTAIADRCKEVVMARSQVAFDDIAFHKGIATACAYDLKRFCEGVPTWGGAALQCLQDHMHTLEFHPLCHDEVEKYLMDAATDIRLASSLREACQPSIDELCSGVEPGQGRVIYCLQARRKDISSGACRNQLLRLMGLAAEDFRMDYILYKACQSDAERFCADVDPHGGQVNACLRRHEDLLSRACRHMQSRLEEIEHEEIRVHPKLKKACAGALSLLCSGVDTRDSQQLVCLQQHQGTVGFPPECDAVLTELRSRAATRFHLNPRLKSSCANDAQQLCHQHFDPDTANGEDESKASAKLLQCLADQAAATSQPCRQEIVRVVHYQMQSYRIGMPLTSPCDGDAMQWCHADSLSTPLVERGFIAECLGQHAVNLTRTCWSVVSLGDQAQLSHAISVENAHYNERISQEMIGQVLEEKLSDREQMLLDKIDTNLMEKIKAHVQTEPVVRIQEVAGGFGVTQVVTVLVAAAVAAAAAVCFVTRQFRKMLIVKNASA